MKDFSAMFLDWALHKLGIGPNWEGILNSEGTRVSILMGHIGLLLTSIERLDSGGVVVSFG